MESKFDMDGMRKRLREGLESKGLSMRSVSLKSGNGSGYVSSVISDGKEPGVANLAAICNAAGLSLSYVMYGIEVSPETEELLRRIEQNPDKRDSIISLLGP